MKRKRVARRPPEPAGRNRWPERWLPILVMLTVPALVIAPEAKENFRLPKLLAAELFGLISLCLLVFRLRAVEHVALRKVLAAPVLVAVLPMALVAGSGLLTSAHPLHVGQALVSLYVALACLVGWSFALRPDEHRRIQLGLLVPASILSLVAIVQFHDLFEIFRFRELVQERIGVTSLAGGAFDLGGFLVLPALIAQFALWQEPGDRRRGLCAVALLLCLYGLAVTQTLTALAALLAASFVLWSCLLPWRRLAAVTALVAVMGAVLVVGVGPLRERVFKKVQSLRSGNLSQVLTGRLDGWRAALWMVEQHPVLGVGHGAYRAEFGVAKLALREEGGGFYTRQHQTHFSNAHSELLEVAAEWGLVGCLAALWAAAILLRRLRRHRASPRAPLMWAAVTALGVLALTSFPLRIALVAYPYLLFLSSIFGAPEDDS